MSSIDIFITIGHRANPKNRPSEDGFTHDWTVFVKGDEGSSIENFVEKVVFHLHESFPKPKRVSKEPPFEVSEEGYAGFILPIDIHFKNKGDPKKLSYEYDMFLRVDDFTSNSRREKLTFHNPAEDFKRRLIRAGGVVHDNKANGSSSSSETALSKSRLINQNLAITNHHSNNSIPASSLLNTIRNKHVIPSKDKSQQQHSSAASNSPNNNQPPSHKKDENNKTKDKHQALSKHSEFTDLFGAPIKTKSSSKETSVKSKKSKSSSEKSCNSPRSSTPTSIGNQMSKEYSEVNKRRKDVKPNKSIASNINSSSQSRSILAKVDDELAKFKKENDLPIDTLSSSSRIKSPASSLNRYQELDRNNNHKYHSKKSNLIKDSLSSSSSSINSYDKHQSRTKDKSNKKRKKRSDSTSSHSAKSLRSSSVASSMSLCSERSRASFSSNYSSSANRHKGQLKKRNNEDQYLLVKKKKKKEANNLPSCKKEWPSSNNISASRHLSSSLSSINSSADCKPKDEMKKKSKEKPKDNYYSKSNDRKSSDSPKFEAADLDDEESESKKGHKKEKKSKDEKKSSKKNKSKDSKGEKKKHKTQSEQEAAPDEIIKEKNKDSINKQTSHKENNLKKEATTSTKISFSNNNSTGTTTLEITSVKNVKMLQSESKKSKQHQDQSLNQSDKRSFKTSDKGKNHYSSPLANNRKYDNETPTSSPCSTTNDKFNQSNYNIGKQEFMTKDDQKKRNQKLNRSYEKIMSDMRKDREISPLSSDLDSEVEDDYNSGNEYGSNDESALKSNHYDGSFDLLGAKKAKKKAKKASSFLGDESASDDEEYRLHVEYVNGLINLQKKISELKDKELLSEIIDIVRESGTFEQNGTLFDFDLMKLDETTIKRVKLCFS